MAISIGNHGPGKNLEKGEKVKNVPPGVPGQGEGGLLRGGRRKNAQKHLKNLTTDSPAENELVYGGGQKGGFC